MPMNKYPSELQAGDIIQIKPHSQANWHISTKVSRVVTLVSIEDTNGDTYFVDPGEMIYVTNAEKTET